MANYIGYIWHRDQHIERVKIFGSRAYAIKSTRGNAQKGEEYQVETPDGREIIKWTKRR